MAIPKLVLDLSIGAKLEAFRTLETPKLAFAATSISNGGPLNVEAFICGIDRPMDVFDSL